MKKLFKLPYWLLLVFSWEKSFRNNPIIGNYWLNRCGLHVARLVVAHLLFRFRLMLLSPLLAKQDRQAFLDNGFILKPNFLPEADFAALKQELKAYNGPISETLEGDTLTQRLFLDRAKAKLLPQCQRFINNIALSKLMRYCSSKNRLPLFYVENLKFHSLDATATDPQQDLHIDTFHPCIKGWFFMDDVDDRNGPHVCIPGSYRLSWRRLRWEYRQSLLASRPVGQDAAARYWDGSFRVGPADLDFMQCQPPKVFCVPANTLLISNVHGIHRRGDAQGQATRMVIWMQARDNPFNPFFTPCPRLTARAFEFFWRRMMAKREQRLAKNGLLRYTDTGFY
jgi:hypothetical protein